MRGTRRGALAPCYRVGLPEHPNELAGARRRYLSLSHCISGVKLKPESYKVGAHAGIGRHLQTPASRSGSCTVKQACGLLGVLLGIWKHGCRVEAGGGCFWNSCHVSPNTSILEL